MYVCCAWVCIGEYRCLWGHEGAIRSPRAELQEVMKSLLSVLGKQTPGLWKHSKRFWPQLSHRFSSYKCFWKHANVIKFTNLILRFQILLNLQTRNSLYVLNPNTNSSKFCYFKDGYLLDIHENQILSSSVRQNIQSGLMWEEFRSLWKVEMMKYNKWVQDSGQ